MPDNWKRVALEKPEEDKVPEEKVIEVVRIIEVQKVEEPKGVIMSENTEAIVENKVPVTNFVVDMPDIPMPEELAVNNEVVEDECKGAFRIAFVGSGQGGSRLAEAFWKLGYRRICCVNCLDGETEALTQRGWIKGFELLRTDNLLTKNPNTNALEWQPLTDLKLYPDYEGPLVAFKSLSFDVVSTPEHRWLTTSKKTGKNVERKSSEFGKNDTHRIHRTGDYLPICKSGLTPDEAELLGWFVTDGGLQTDRKTPVAFIFQSWTGNREKCERISELLERLDASRGQVKLGKHKNGTYYRWTLGKHLSTLLYGRCPSRTLTVESMIDLDRPALDRLREAMILGDGCRASGKTVLCTGRKEQADAFQVLCTLTGAASGSVWRDMSMYSPHSEKMSNVPKCDGVWYVTILKRDKAQVVGNQRRDFTGKVPVWCPVVPNNFFVARRKGYVFITGNTTGQDLASINITVANKLVMDMGSGGASKDPTKGETSAKKYYEDIYDLMRRCFGKKFDRIIVCVGAGGGTGGGSSNILIDIAHDIAKSFKIEAEDGQPAVGVLVSLPKVSEGAKVNENAYTLLDGLLSRVGKGKGKQDGRTISPLIIVDNDRVEKIYPNLSVTQFWDVANRSISSLLHLFNSIACQDSDYTTFDRADMADVLSSGVVSFGACPIKKWDTMTDISFSIRDNLKNNVLVSGFETSNAKAAACVFIGSPDVLEKIPQSFLEHGFEMLTRIMKQGGVLHRGIYKGSKPGLVVYTMLGELGRPDERMTEIARVAGINRR